MPDEAYHLLINHWAQWIAAPAHCVANQIHFDVSGREIAHLLSTVGIGEAMLAQRGFRPVTNLKRRVAEFRVAKPKGASYGWQVRGSA